MPQLFPIPSPHCVPATSPRDRPHFTSREPSQHSDSETTNAHPTSRFHAVSKPISQSLHSASDEVRADDPSQAHHVHFASPPSHPPRHWTRPSPSPYVRPPPPSDILPAQLDVEKQPEATGPDPRSVPSASSEESEQEECGETHRAMQRHYYVVSGFGWRIRRVYVWVFAGLAVIALPAAIGLSQI
jgi:hypothetical protein